MTIGSSINSIRFCLFPWSVCVCGEMRKAQGIEVDTEMVAAPTEKSGERSAVSKSVTATRSIDFLSPGFRNNFVFKGLAMKRATSVVHLLRCVGSILESSVGSAATFNLSRQAEDINYFISHNWDTPRYEKFLTLAMYFNRRAAHLLTLGAMILCTILTGLGLVRAFDNPYGRVSLVCTPLGVPLFFMVIFFAHDVERCLGCSRANVFLDKICIHQTDPSEKKKGVESLGAFLYASEKMLIVYTNLYLNKLWTMYELASFLALRSSKDILVMPTATYVTTYFSALVCYCVTLIYSVSITLGGVSEDVALLVYCAALVVVLAWMAVVLRRTARSRTRALTDALNFRVANAHCTVEEDRPLVNEMIGKLMKQLKYVDRNETPEGSLTAFEDLVHKVVPPLLQKKFGSSGFPYRKILIASQAMLWKAFDRMGGYVQEGRSTQFVFAFGMYTITQYFALAPCTILLADFISTRRLDDAGWTQAALYAAVPIVCVPFHAGADHLLWYLNGLAGTSTLALAFQVTTACALCALVRAVYRPRPLAADPEPIGDARDPAPADKELRPAVIGVAETMSV